MSLTLTHVFWGSIIWAAAFFVLSARDNARKREEERVARLKSLTSSEADVTP
jgi:hypothetical protein